MTPLIKLAVERQEPDAPPEPLFAAACALSAAIAYADGWRVGRPRAYGDSSPLNADDWRAVARLEGLFLAGGELFDLVLEHRFRDRRSLAEHKVRLSELYVYDVYDD